MKVEGVVSQGKRIGNGTIEVGIDGNSLVLNVAGKPRPKSSEKFQPLKGEVVFPLEKRNLKNLFRLAVEGRTSLIQKARREKEVGFDEKLSAGEGVYARFRGAPWAFSVLVRKGNEEAFFVMKPREFYPIVVVAEVFLKKLPSFTAIVTKDLDVLMCTAEPGKLSFRTVETDSEAGEITERDVLMSLASDLEDRARIPGMYPAKFGPITLIEKHGSPFIRIGGKHYKTDRQGLLTLKLLCHVAARKAKSQNTQHS